MPPVAPPPVGPVVREPGPGRSVAATIVAATGALLLLAAAGTFLAVSWDVLGVTARVAVVGTATAATIVGGRLLQRRLPAVGQVVFHLGVLLVPIDAFGLCVQLGASRAVTWSTVGATALVALGVGAAYVRSPWLAAGAVVGVPVGATGLALAGLGAAPVLVAIAAVLALPAAWLRRDDGQVTVSPTASPTGTPAEAPAPAPTADAVTDPEPDETRPPLSPGRVVAWWAPVLAVVTVVAPMAALVAQIIVEGAFGRVGPILAAIVDAGWPPQGWVPVVVAGTIAVVVVAVVAAVRRHPVLAGLVALVATMVVANLLVADTPSLAQWLAPPLLLLVVEVVALASVGDRRLAETTVIVARCVEAIAAVTVPATMVVVASVTEFGADHRHGAAAATVGAVAWLVAAARRWLARSRSTVWSATAGAVTPAIQLCLVAAVLAAATAATLLGPVSGIGLALVVVAVAALALLRGAGGPGMLTSLLVVALGSVALTAATTSTRLVPASSASWRAWLVAGMVVGVVVAWAFVRRVVAHLAVSREAGTLAALLLLPLLLGPVVATGHATEQLAGGDVSTAAAGLLLLGLAVLLDRLRPAADALRIIAVAVALFAGATEASALDGAAAAVITTLVVAAGLTAELLRTGRGILLVAVGPVAVRAVAGVLWATTSSRTATGAVLLAIAVATALVAVAIERHRVATTVTSVVALVPGVVLLAPYRWAIAWATVAVGLAVLATGALRREVAIAHVGGAFTTLGVWQLLVLGDIGHLDAWVAAPALHLWLTASAARRAGRISSWVADVPPLLLVAVPAVLERLAGGNGWHAGAAGALGLVAVIGGGYGRHAGPLLTGAVVLVGVVVVEVVAVVAAVPTWVWLAVGGVVLVAAAILIERSGGGPASPVRRLRDVLSERFD